MKIKTLKIFILALFLFTASITHAGWFDWLFSNTSNVGGGMGTLEQLDQWRATSTPVAGITTNVAGKTIYAPYSDAYFNNLNATTATITTLTNCDTIDTDANGLLSCGTDGGGGGATDQLGQIGDVSTSSPMTYGEVIIYNTATSEWESVATSTLGLGGSSGTVSSVAMTVPTGLTVSGSPITTTGTLGLTYTAGYEGLATTDKNNWNTAYGWGDHSIVGYLTDIGSQFYTYFNATTTDALTEGSSNLYFPGFTSLSADYSFTDNSSNWDTAYGWGNHSGLYDILGQATSTLASHTTTYNHTNYDTAYNWGDHALAGYNTQAFASSTYAIAGGAFHDGFSDFVANEHIDWTGASAGTIHATNYVDNNTTYTSSDFTHDDLTGFVANEHLDWTADLGAVNINAENYTDTNTTYTGTYPIVLTGTAFSSAFSTTTANTFSALNIFGNASTTQLTVSDKSWLGTILSGVWNGTAIDISDYTNLVGGTNITLSGDTLNVDDAFLINSGNDTTSGVITSAGLIVGNGQTVGATTNKWLFDDTGGDITTTGNVGIGTTAPTSTLQVMGTASIKTSTGAESLFVATTGNIGIGTTAPEAKLQVIGASQFGDATNKGGFDADGDLLFLGTADYLVASDDYAFRAIANEDAGIKFMATGGARVSIYDITGAENVYFGAGNADVTRASYFKGNVGIATTSPAVKLDVNGIIKTQPASSRTCNALAEGGIMYDSDVKKFFGCNGEIWEQLTN